MKKVSINIGGRHIGGSSLAAANGLSPWTSPLELAVRLKTGVTPNVFSEEQIHRMELGTALEPHARNLFTKKTGIKVDMPETGFADDEHPFLVAHLDGICKDAVIELKWSEKGFGEIPIHYKAQACQYMDIMNLKKTWFGVLGPSSFKIFEYEYDPHFHLPLKKGAIAFWEKYVEGGEYPPVDSSHSSGKGLKALYPDDNGDILETNPKMEELLKKRSDLDAPKKELDLINNQIKELLKDNSFYNSEEYGRISYKKTKDSFKWKALSKVDLSKEERVKFIEEKKGTRTLRFQK